MSALRFLFCVLYKVCSRLGTIIDLAWSHFFVSDFEGFVRSEQYHSSGVTSLIVCKLGDKVCEHPLRTIAYIEATTCEQRK